MTKIQVRRGAASTWTSANPTLTAGELGYETDTGKLKVGDGATAWTSLVYVTASSSTGVTSAFGRTGAVTATTGDYAVAQVTGAAPLASPALTGTPTAPTAGTGTSTTQIATTSFVMTAVGVVAGGSTSDAIADCGAAMGVGPYDGGSASTSSSSFVNHLIGGHAS